MRGIADYQRCLPFGKILADSSYCCRAIGATASVFLSRSVITNNTVGVGASGGGVVASYSDNRFAGNGIDGKTAAIPQQ